MDDNSTPDIPGQDGKVTKQDSHRDGTKGFTGSLIKMGKCIQGSNSERWHAQGSSTVSEAYKQKSPEKEFIGYQEGNPAKSADCKKFRESIFQS